MRIKRKKKEEELDKNFNKVKGMMFDLKKKVCLNDVKACSISTFNKGNITSKNRNKCSACHIIANDIDISIKKYINVKNKNNNHFSAVSKLFTIISLNSANEISPSPLTSTSLRISSQMFFFPNFLPTPKTYLIS